MGNTKRIFLWTLVATLALGAALGIWVVIFGTFLGLDEEVFGTLGTLFLFSLPGLMAAGMWERGHWRGANVATLVVVGIGTLVFLTVVWFDTWSLFGGDDAVLKAMFLSAIWAWALPWAAGIGLTRFSDGLRWVRVGSITVLLSLACLISVMILLEVGEDIWQLPAVLGILTALGTIATPILYVIAGDRRGPAESLKLELHVRCPRCLLEQTLATGTSRCARCRLRFTIDIEEPRCPQCRYLLHGLTTPRCPECGHALASEEVVAS